MEASGERLEQSISWHKCHSSRLATREDGTVDLKVFKTCKNLIRTLPVLCYSKSQPDDVDTEAEDYCYDALRYGLTRRKIEFRSVRVRMRF
jgi:hypothetical protein